MRFDDDESLKLKDGFNQMNQRKQGTQVSMGDVEKSNDDASSIKPQIPGKA